MKNFLSFILLTFALVGHSKSIAPYFIKSDVYSVKVPTFKTLVKGCVKQNGQFPLAGALISTEDHKKQTYSDSLGNFSLEIDLLDSVVYMFKEGYQEVVVKYDFQPGHIVEIQFNPMYDMEMIIVDKPVIYAYSEERTDFTLGIKPKGNFTFTYPAIKNKWTCSVDNSGLIEHQGAKYPYLFWESETDDLELIKNSDDKLEGFFIKTDTVIQFLEKQLTQINFNERERTDFITYWGPRLIQKKYALLQFLTEKDYDENIASMDCSPKPDNIIRFFMSYYATDIKTIEERIQIVEPELKAINRSGFYLIEWGGAAINRLPFTLSQI